MPSSARAAELASLSTTTGNPVDKEIRFNGRIAVREAGGQKAPLFRNTLAFNDALMEPGSTILLSKFLGEGAKI